MTKPDRPERPPSIVSVRTGELLRQLREAEGLSQAELGDALGLHQSQISDRENGKTAIDVDFVYQVCDYFKRPIQVLLPGRPSDAPRPKLSHREANLQQQWPAQFLPDFIPIRTSLRHGMPPGDWVPRPPALLNVSDAYAFYMTGVTMLPRFRPGQRLYVNPHRPPSPGAGIIVIDPSSTHIIGQYLDESPESIKTQFLNPARILEIRRRDIIEVHTIIGLDEF